MLLIGLEIKNMLLIIIKVFEQLIINSCNLTANFVE